MFKDIESAAKAYSVVHTSNTTDLKILESLCEMLMQIPSRHDEAILHFGKLFPLAKKVGVKVIFVD